VELGIAREQWSVLFCNFFTFFGGGGGGVMWRQRAERETKRKDREETKKRNAKDLIFFQMGVGSTEIDTS
jgi:hypothetical protein